MIFDNRVLTSLSRLEHLVPASGIWHPASPLPAVPVADTLRGMESHDLLRAVYATGNPTQIAADLGLSLSLIYKWAEPSDGTGSGALNPLDRLDQLVRCTGNDRIVQWICQRAGGFFIRNPRAVWPHPSDLVPATNQVVQEFADLLAVVASAAADNQVSPAEARSIRARWEDLKTATEAFVRCCEEGNFDALRAAAAARLKPAG